MPKISFNWKFFSSYYISTLIVYFLLQVKVIENILISITYWLATLISVNGYKDIVTDGKIWLLLLVFIVVFTWAMQNFVVQPLGFFVDNENRLTGWMRFLGIILLFGSQIFLINKISNQPMPVNLIPIPNSWNVFLIRVLGGFENTFPVKETEVEKMVWQIRDIFWHLGPITFMFLKGKAPAKTA